MLQIRTLSRPGLAPVNLDLAPGEALALLGPSGSGKTLLLRAIADLDPNEGHVSLGGEPREAMTAPNWRQRVTYLAAEPGWWADRAGDHFPEPESAAALVTGLGLSEAIMTRPIAELSTGERHRLALARVLVQSPQVLLLDEPTSGLDQETAHAVEMLLRARLDAGTALLFSTHDEELAERLGDHKLRMRDGQAEDQQS